MYTTLKLKFVRQSSSGKGRLYENERGGRQWVPVSIMKSCLKHPALTPQHLSVHEVQLPEWWVEKNPWPASKQQELL